MLELIVLGAVLARVTAIARWPGPKHRTENRTPPAPGPWTPQSDWRRFDRPTYLRRGIVPGDGQGRFTSPAERPSPAGEAAQSPATREA
ncbi:MAG: hypothetical protein WAK53_14420, partial [Chromatiaceae bacterium]